MDDVTDEIRIVPDDPLQVNRLVIRACADPTDQAGRIGRGAYPTRPLEGNGRWAACAIHAGRDERHGQESEGCSSDGSVG